MKSEFKKDQQYYKFCLYGFLKNLKFYEPFLLLFILQKLDGNYTQAMSLYSIRFIVRSILEIPSGIIADAIGRIGSLVCAYGLYILSFVAYYFADSYLLLLIPSFLFGLGDAFRTGTHKAMIIEYLKINNWHQAKTQYYGHTRSWSQAGSAISALMAAGIVFITNDLDIVFLAAVVPLVIGFFLLLSYPKELDKKYHAISLKQNLKQSLTDSWTSLSKKKNIRLLFNTSFYFGFHNSVKDLLQPVLQTVLIILPLGIALKAEQKTALLIGIFYFVIYFLSVLTSRYSGSISTVFKSPISAVNCISAIGIVICLFISLAVYMNAYLLATIIFIPFFPLISMQRPFVISKISENIDGKIMATTLSVESQLGSIIAAIIALLAGVLIEFAGIGIGLGVVSVMSLIIVSVMSVNQTKK